MKSQIARVGIQAVMTTTKELMPLSTTTTMRNQISLVVLEDDKNRMYCTKIDAFVNVIETTHMITATKLTCG